MAEFAQFRLEEGVPELERLEKLQLLDKKEISQVIKRRKIHEYRIQRSLKSKDNYLKYIKYELNLLALISIRQHRIANNWGEFKLVRSAVCKRVNKLFKQAVLRYPSDVKLWLSFIEFCRRVKYTTSISSVYTSMLKVHNNKPDLWMAAARWEWEENKSVDTARQLLLRAVRFLPKSKLLFVELFRVELLNSRVERQKYLENSVAGNQDEDAFETDPIISGKVAEAVYRNAVAAINDVDFFVRLIRICQEFDFTDSLQDKIYSDLKKTHPNDEMSCATIAIRPLIRTDNPNTDVNILEQQCFSNFEVTVQSLPTEKMWSTYIEFCKNRLNVQQSQGNRNHTVKHLLDVFSRASAVNLLAPNLYVQWAELASHQTPEKCAKILEVATERFPKEASLWIERIAELLRSSTASKDVRRLFNQAFAATPSKDSLPLWNMAVRWNVLNKPSNVDIIINLGMRMPTEVAKHAKLFQLERSALRDGLSSARRLYKRIWSTPPINLEFFYAMLDIEEAAPTPSIKELRVVMDHACAHFGKQEIDLWMRCMKIEQTYANVWDNHVTLLHLRAIKRLSPELVDQFVALQNLSVYKIGETVKGND